MSFYRNPLVDHDALASYLNGFEAAPTRSAPDILKTLADSPDVRQALTQAGIANDVQGLLKQHGGDVRKLLATSGVDLKAIAQQAGLPPEAGALFALPGIFKTKGTEGKIIAATEAANSAIATLVGPAGSAGAAVNKLIADAVGIEKTAASSVGGSVGMATGSALFGPAGGFVGQAVGQAAGAGVRAIGKILGLTHSQKEIRANRENDRVNDDIKRRNAFKGNLVEAFNAGKIVFTQGVPGSNKYDSEILHLIVRGKKVVPIKRAEVEEMFVRGAPSPYVYKNKMLVTSIHMSNKLLKAITKHEAAVAETRSAEQLHKVKKALVQGLKQAAAQHKKATQPVPQKEAPLAKPQVKQPVKRQEQKIDKLKKEIADLQRKADAARKARDIALRAVQNKDAQRQQAVAAGLTPAQAVAATASSQQQTAAAISQAVAAAGLVKSQQAQVQQAAAAAQVPMQTVQRVMSMQAPARPAVPFQPFWQRSFTSSPYRPQTGAAAPVEPAQPAIASGRPDLFSFFRR
jgi:hypothetical protein